MICWWYCVFVDSLEKTGSCDLLVDEDDSVNFLDWRKDLLGCGIDLLAPRACCDSFPDCALMIDSDPMMDRLASAVFSFSAALAVVIVGRVRILY